MLLVLAAWLGGPGAPGLRAQATVRPGDVVIMGGRLWDGTGDQPRPNPGILLRNGSIRAVGGAWAADMSGADSVVRLDDDETVLSGFIDMHAHYAVDLFGEGRVDEYEVNPLVYLANGVTSTFPAGEMDPEGMRRARLDIDSGLRPGPRIFNSGPYFGSARPGWDNDAVTPDSVRAEVDHWAGLGVRSFKAKGIDAPHLEALIAAAHRHGLTVTAHLDSGVGRSVNPADAIRMGIDRVEHFLGGGLTPPVRSAYASFAALDLSDPASRDALEDVIARYRSSGTFFDPTLSTYAYYFPGGDPTIETPWTDEMRFLTPYARKVVEARLPERRPNAQFAAVYQAKRATVKAFVEQGAGDLLTLGTDHPSWGQYLAGFSVHRELLALVEAGLTPAQALRAATVNGARALGLGERLGTVEAGKWADLVVVRGDPLVDIRATRRVALVVRSGTLHDPAALLAAAEGRLGPTGEADADRWKGDVRFSPPRPASPHPPGTPSRGPGGS